MHDTHSIGLQSHETHQNVQSDLRAVEWRGKIYVDQYSPQVARALERLRSCIEGLQHDVGFHANFLLHHAVLCMKE